METRVTTLAGMAEAPTGGIASRSLLSNPAGSVTLFAFDAGQSIQEHSAPFDALLQILEGSLEIRIGSENHLASAGQILTLPARIPHALRAPEHARALLTMIRNPQENRP